MKAKLLTLLAIMAIVTLSTSCDKVTPEEKDTTKSYQITNNVSFISSNPMEYLDGTMYEVIIFQYYDGNIIKQDNLPDIAHSGGKSAIIETDPLCEKVRVSFRILPPQSPYFGVDANKRKYVSTHFYMVEGETQQIVVDMNTMMTEILTKSGEVKLRDIFYEKKEK